MKPCSRVSDKIGNKLLIASGFLVNSVELITDFVVFLTFQQDCKQLQLSNNYKYLFYHWDRDEK